MGGTLPKPLDPGTTLLDLGDELLLHILFLVQNVPDIVRFGAVNKRLYKLHFSVRRLRATITTRRPGENVFLQEIARQAAGQEAEQAKLQLQSLMEELQELQARESGPALQHIQHGLQQISCLQQALGAAEGDENALFHALLNLGEEHSKLNLSSEADLYRLLAAVARKGGGFLRVLTVFIDQDDFRRLREVEFARLDWITLVSASLQALELAFYTTNAAPGDLFSDLASCTNLESLSLTCGSCEFVITAEMLARLTAACSKLKYFVVQACFQYEGLVEIELASKRLETLSLTFDFPEPDDQVRCLRLETPALTHLTTKMELGKLDLCSHALRSLSIGSLKEFNSATPLSNLTFLSTGSNGSSGALDQALGSLSSRRLKSLVISDKSVPVTKLSGIISRHLGELEHLRICLQERGPRVDAPVVEAVGVSVGEILVVVARRHASESDQYEHLYNSVVILCKGFPSVGKILVVDYHFVDREAPPRWVEATGRALEDLKCKFPGLVSSA